MIEPDVDIIMLPVVLTQEPNEAESHVVGWQSSLTVFINIFSLNKAEVGSRRCPR